MKSFFPATGRSRFLLRTTASSIYRGLEGNQHLHLATSTQLLVPKRLVPRLLSAAFSHSVVIRSASTLRRNPGDDLVRVLTVAGLAVDAVGSVQTDAFSIRRGRIV